MTHIPLTCIDQGIGIGARLSPKDRKRENQSLACFEVDREVFLKGMNIDNDIRGWCHTRMSYELLRLGCAERFDLPALICMYTLDRAVEDAVFAAPDDTPYLDNAYAGAGVLQYCDERYYWNWMAERHPEASEPWMCYVELLQRTSPYTYASTEKRIGHTLDHIVEVIHALRALPNDSGAQVVWEMLATIPHTPSIDAWFRHHGVTTLIGPYDGY